VRIIEPEFGVSSPDRRFRFMIDKRQDQLAPDFTATDSEGVTIRLSDYRNKKNVVLVFNRGFF